jgi:phosphohistidine phosphatase SixA
MRRLRALVPGLLNNVRGGKVGYTTCVYLPAVLAVLLAFIVRNSAALDVVYVMRHAQKASGWSGDDKFLPLSEKGVRCATRRAQSLGGKGIVAVYANETVRTLATGMAVSIAHSNIEIIGDDKTREASIAEYLEARHPSQSGGAQTAVLVVGKSENVQDLILALRPDAKDCLKDLKLSDPLPQAQYGDIWRIELRIDPAKGKIDPTKDKCPGISHGDPLDDCGTSG